MREQQIQEMISKVLQSSGENTDILQDEMMLSMVCDIMESLGTNELNVLITLKKKDITEIKKAMELEMGLIDINGLKTLTREQDSQIKRLKESLESREELTKRMGKRLESRKHEVEALKKQIEILKQTQTWENLDGKEVVFKEDYCYGSILDYEIDEDILNLIKEYAIKLDNNNIVVKKGTRVVISTDKHGYSLNFNYLGKFIELQCGGFDEDLEQGKATIEVL